jgi:hypothetical protein
VYSGLVDVNFYRPLTAGQMGACLQVVGIGRGRRLG